jgi:hypothetical protein
VGAIRAYVMPARMPMMIITSNNSMTVYPPDRRKVERISTT